MRKHALFPIDSVLRSLEQDTYMRCLGIHYTLLVLSSPCVLESSLEKDRNP